MSLLLTFPHSIAAIVGVRHLLRRLRTAIAATAAVAIAAARRIDLIIATAAGCGGHLDGDRFQHRRTLPIGLTAAHVGEELFVVHCARRVEADDADQNHSR